MASSFFGDRLRSLRPQKVSDDELVKNPLKLIASIPTMGKLFLFAGWLAWTVDGYDYFSVSLTSGLLATQFGKNTTDITRAITLTLLFRSVGAIIFGVLSDRFGRKWTLIANLLLVAIFELGSSFCNTYSQFLAVRSLFGIAMGGIWGQATSLALENVPVGARGLVSGFLQQGYAVGYLLAAVVNLTLVPKTVHSWRALYWVGCGLSVFAAIVRLVLPESAIFLRAKAEAKERGETSGGKGKAFMRELGQMLKQKWLLAIWAVLLMTGFNFLSHGSQDLYPTYLQKDKLLSADLSSKATIIANCGAVAGGCLFGYLSQYMGRRLSIIVALLFIACFIPLWIIPTTFGPLSAGSFFVQFGVQGAWGVIPIFLAESSPPAFRSTFGGVAYQLGNMISSSASQIEATAGETLTKKAPTGAIIPDYATIMGILLGVVIAWTLLFTFLGPSNDHAHFEEAKVGFQSGAGAEDGNEYLKRMEREERARRDTEAYPEGGVKPEMTEVEKVSN